MLIADSIILISMGNGVNYMYTFLRDDWPEMQKLASTVKLRAFSV